MKKSYKNTKYSKGAGAAGRGPAQTQTPNQADQSNQVCQRLFPVLDQVLPEFGLQLADSKWSATAGTTPCCNSEASGHLSVYRNTPFGLKCHRCSEFTHLTTLVQGGFAELKALADQQPVIAGPLAPDPEPVDPEREQALQGIQRIAGEYLFSGEPDAVQALQYLAARGIPAEYARQAGYGLFKDPMYMINKLGQSAVTKAGMSAYNMAGRIIAPFCDNAGQLLGFWGRLYNREGQDGDPKYLNSDGFRRHYPYQVQAIDPAHPVIVVEGMLSADVLRANGIANCVASGSANLSREQVRALVSAGVRQVVLNFDYDPESRAGAEGMLRAIPLLQEAGLRVYVVRPWTMADNNRPQEKADPDSCLLRTGIAHYNTILKAAVPPELFVVEHECYQIAQFDPASNPQDLDTLIQCAAREIEKQRSDDITRRQLGQYIANCSGNDYAAIETRLETQRQHEAHRVKCEQAAGLLLTAAGNAKDGDLDAAHQIIRNEMPALASSADIPEDPFFDAPRFMEYVRHLGTDRLNTGFKDLDERAPFVPGEFIMLTARVRHGKSSFAYNLVLNMLRRNPEHTIILLTPDVPDHFAVARMATIWAHKHRGNVLNSKTDIIMQYGKVCQDGSPALPRDAQDAIEALGQYGRERRLILLYKPNWTTQNIDELVAKVQAAGCKVGAVIIDYAEMIQVEERSEGRERQVGETAHGLRILANERNVAVVLLAQTNREGKCRPSLENLRYSGQQEQEASTVLALYNESQAISRPEPDVNMPIEEEVELELIILKNRSGAQGTIPLKFHQTSGVIGETIPEIKPQVLPRFGAPQSNNPAAVVPASYAAPGPVGGKVAAEATAAPV